MADSYKDIIITPNRSNTADPKIDLRGGNSSVNTAITVTVYPDSNGTLSFDGSAGQLFSITNDLSGLLWSVNDVSGIPSAEVYANGSVRLAEFSGNVSIGTATNSSKLYVNGNTTVNGSINVTSTMAAGNTTITGFANVSSTLNAAGAITQNGNQVLHAGNYTSYAPSLTGSGASGTWGISITGNAAGATFSNDSANQDNITNRTDSGFYQSISGTTAEGWPLNDGGWQHMISCTHTNNDNYYAMQLGSGFYSQGLFYRATNGSGSTAWSRVALYNNSYDAALYASAYYDTNNTAFYVDPASSSVLSTITAKASSDVQLYLDGNGTSWAGINWADVAGNDSIWYNGSGRTFAIGGDGSNVANKKLHVHGGVTIGSGLVSTSVSTNGLLVETRVDAPIFYDSANTSFYVDPGSTSNLNGLTVASTITGSITGNAGTVTNGVYTTGNQTISGTKVFTDGIGLDGAGASNDPYGRMSVTRPADANNYSYYGMTRAGQLGAGFGLDASNRFWWGSATAGYAGVASATGMTMTVAGIVTASSDFRAPIFYDSNDTGYYIDPNGTSQIVKLRVISAGNQAGGNIKIGQAGEGSNKWSYITSSHYNDTSESEGVSLIGAYTSSSENRVVIGGSIYEANPATEIQFFTHNAITHSTGGSQRLNIGSGGVVTAYVDMRAPIFYDSDNTTYFIDGNNVSSLFGVAIRGDANNIGTGNQLTLWDGGGTTTSAIGFKANGGVFANPTGAGDGYNTYLTMDGAGRGWVFRRGTGGTDFTAAYTSGWILNNGIWQANASMRSPIFYDSDNTAYYLDAANAGSYDALKLNGGIQFAIANPYLQSSSYFVIPGGAYFNSGTVYTEANIKARGGVGNDTAAALTLTGGTGGYTQINGSARSPIFYDSDDTAYYTDPAGTTRLNTTRIAGKFYAQGGTGVDECCGSDATISVGGSGARPPSISWHYSGVMQGNMQGNQTGWRKIYFYDDQGNGLGIHATGQIASNADVIAYYSDKRLKKDFVRVVDHWNVINNLTGYRFTWNERSGEIDGFRDKVGMREVGLIAQDVKAVYPEAIAMRTEGPEDDPYMTIKHDRFTAVFIEALKDLRKELDEVKEENKKLREMINGQ